jgi:hypothetical protein
MEADAGMGVGEAGTFRRHQEIAVESQLESTRHSHPVDGTDDRLRGGKGGAPTPARDCLRLGPTGLTLEDPTVSSELLQVEAGTEGGIGTGEDEDVDVVTDVGLTDESSECLYELRRHGVSGLGTIESDGGDPVGHFEENDVRHRRALGEPATW